MYRDPRDSNEDPFRVAEALYREHLADPRHLVYGTGQGGLPPAALHHLKDLARRDGYVAHESNVDDVGMDWRLTRADPRE
jgi:hypothetical protein